MWPALFCQNCGKSVRYAATVNGVIVCEACTEVALSLPAAAELGQLSDNHRFVWVEGGWAGRFCKQCFGFVSIGVGHDGLCLDCHTAGQPGCAVCGQTPTAPFLGHGERLCAVHTRLKTAGWGLPNRVNVPAGQPTQTQRF